MRIKVIAGHLTSTEKKAIAAILKAKVMRGKVGRKSYFLSLENDVYTVKIVENKRGLGFIGEKLRSCTDTHKFIIKK